MNRPRPKCFIFARRQAHTDLNVATGPRVRIASRRQIERRSDFVLSAAAAHASALCASAAGNVVRAASLRAGHAWGVVVDGPPEAWMRATLSQRNR